MWDVLYWTWINMILVIVFGNRAWWLYLVVPGYAIFAAVSTASGLKSMLGGMGGAGTEPESQSNRQKKMEKRGGQKGAYR
jgi:SRP-independent targeting protein 2/TMEM208